MIARDPITIIGPALDAWLAATMFARFAPLAGARLQVMETSSIPAESEIVIARPEMMRTHVSIGLNLEAIGARAAQSWTGPNGQAIPFTPFGKPLKGVSFSAIHHRARTELGETRPLSAFLASKDTGAFAIESARYVDALKAIATKVGVTRCTQASGNIIQADPNFTSDKSVRVVGAAAITLRPPAHLRLHAVHQTVLALIDCWPWSEGDDELAILEYERRLSGIRASFTDMQTLLSGDTANTSPSLQHRIDVWHHVGRLAPMDDDQFLSQEWIAALLNAGSAPRSGGRLAHALTSAEITAHIEACAPKEVANV